MNAIQSRKAKDVGLKCTSACGRFRIIAATTTDIVRHTMKAHKFPSLDATKLQATTHGAGSSSPSTLPYYHAEQAELLATSITWTNMMSLTLRQEERFNVRVITPDFLGGAPSIEAMALGECRANFGQLHSIQTNPGLEAISEDTPQSYTTFANRVMYNQSKPVTSATSCLVNTRRGMGNMTPHAQHFLTQSDGTPSAVLLLCCYDYAKQHMAWSGGVMVQAIAPGATDGDEGGRGAVDNSARLEEESLKIVEHRQAVFDTMWWEPQPVVLERAEAPGSAGELQATDSKLLEDLHLRHTSSGLLMYDLLSLATFNPDAVRDVCHQNRLNVPPTTTTAILPPASSSNPESGEMTSSTSSSPDSGRPYLPAEFIGQVVRNKQVIALTAEKERITRTALDFFCRCTKKGFLDSIHVLGEEECVKLRASASGEKGEGGLPSVPMTCSHCTKVHHLVDADWVEVMTRFEKIV